MRTPSINSVYYAPGAVPKDAKNLQRFLQDELRKVQNAVNTLALGHLDKSHTGPARPREGDIRIADGTSWDPGLGAGLYFYLNGAWNKLNFERATTVATFYIHVENYGAVGGGVTDDSAAFQSAIDYADSIGGGTVVFSDKHYLASTITVKDYVSLLGPLDIADEIKPAASASYQGKNGALILNSAATITLNDSATLGGCVVTRYGMTLPFADAAAATSGVAAFAGTAVTVAGQGAYIHHALILGFARAIDSTSFERTRCEYVFGDCTNGIRLATVYDIAYIENCHFWPFTTVHQTWTTDALLVRTGTAYEFNSVGDWSKLTNCFSYGYAVGFDVDSCDHVQMIGCGSDYPTGLASTSVGARVRGTSRDALLLGYQCAAQGTGVLINSTASNKLAARIIGADCWNNDTYHIRVQDGSASIIGCTTTDGSVGVLIDSTSDGSLVDGCTFSGVTTPISASGTALEKSTIGENRFINCVDASVGVRHTFDNQTDTEVITSYNASGNGYELIGRYSKGSAAAPTVVGNGESAFMMVGEVYDGSAFNDVARIRLIADGAPSAGATPGGIIFSTTPAASATLVDSWKLSNAGNLLPVTDNTFTLGSAGFRALGVYATKIYFGAGATFTTSGAGTPEGVVTAPVGSTYTRTDGGAGTTLYVKESGAGNTGWVAK